MAQLTSLSFDDKAGAEPAKAPADGAKKEPEKKPSDAAKKETEKKPAAATEKKPDDAEKDKKPAESSTDKKAAPEKKDGDKPKPDAAKKDDKAPTKGEEELKTGKRAPPEKPKVHPDDPAIAGIEHNVKAMELATDKTALRKKTESDAETQAINQMKPLHPPGIDRPLLHRQNLQGQGSSPDHKLQQKKVKDAKDAE